MEYSGNRTYSPLLLNTEWPTLWRLILFVFIITFGSTINGFFVASFFVEKSLKKKGNAYLACSGLADMMITSVVMPIAGVVLLSSGAWEKDCLCLTAQFLVQASGYSYALFFLMVSIESVVRVSRPSSTYEMFLNRYPICYICVSIFLLSLLVSGYGVCTKRDYDYCSRSHFGDWDFRVITGIIFQALPFIVTLVLLIMACLLVRARARRDSSYRRSHTYDDDYSLTNLNLASYILFVALWIPYLVVVYKFPMTQDSYYYNCAWLGVGRSIVSGVVYSSLNPNFRRGFAHLFVYCCCKSNLTSQFVAGRNRRVYNDLDVKVHIMHHSLNQAAQQPQRNAVGVMRDGNMIL